MVHELSGLSLVNPSLHILDGFAYQRESSLAPESSLQPPRIKLLRTADPNTAQSSAFTVCKYLILNHIYFFGANDELIRSPFRYSWALHIGVSDHVTHYWKHLDILDSFSTFSSLLDESMGWVRANLDNSWGGTFQAFMGYLAVLAWQRTHTPFLCCGPLSFILSALKIHPHLN